MTNLKPKAPPSLFEIGKTELQKARRNIAKASRLLMESNLKLMRLRNKPLTTRS